MSRLGAISAPTLVVHGEQDRILPFENGRSLAAHIPGARRLTLAKGGDALPTDVPGATREVVSFLLAQKSRQGRRKTRTGREARA